MKSLGVERMGRCTLEEWMVIMGLGILIVVLELLMQPKARWGLMLSERRREYDAYMFYSYGSLYNCFTSRNT